MRSPKPRIVIRADAGCVPEVGTGHVVRSIRLADEMKRSPVFADHDIVFISQVSAEYRLGPDLIGQAGYDVLPESNISPNSDHELSALLAANPSIAIFDRLSTNSSQVRILRESGIFVVTFDDLGSGRTLANLAFNPLLQNVAPSPNVRIGYDYFFSNIDAIEHSEVCQQVRSVFISFGGFDFRNLNELLLVAIRKCRGIPCFNMIYGGNSPDTLRALRVSAQELAEIAEVRVTVHHRPPDFIKLLTGSDLAIVSGGLTAITCAQAGVPAIAIPQYDHQIETLARLQGLGCLAVASNGMDVCADLISDAVNRVSADYLMRMQMSRVGRQIIDGMGLHRTVREIELEYLRWNFSAGERPESLRGANDTGIGPMSN